jgi:opacity protein-like surface antigen
MFAIVGEVAGAYKSETMAVGTSSVDATVNLHTFMGGVRVSARTHPKVVPFGQVLLGAARVSGGVTASGPAVPVIEVSDSDTRFALQIGGGVNLMTSGNFGVRLGVDYRRIFVSDAGENEFRVAAASSFRSANDRHSVSHRRARDASFVAERLHRIDTRGAARAGCRSRAR